MYLCGHGHRSFGSCDVSVDFADAKPFAMLGCVHVMPVH